MLALESLSAASAVHCEVTPQANWYRVNSNHFLMKKALEPAFEAEELFWDDLRKLVRRLVRPRPVAAVATGPRPDSDPPAVLQRHRTAARL